MPRDAPEVFDLRRRAKLREVLVRYGHGVAAVEALPMRDNIEMLDSVCKLHNVSSQQVRSVLGEG